MLTGFWFDILGPDLVGGVHLLKRWCSMLYIGWDTQFLAEVRTPLASFDCVGLSHLEVCLRTYAYRILTYSSESSISADPRLRDRKVKHLPTISGQLVANL